MRIFWSILVALALTACASGNRDRAEVTAAQAIDPIALQAASVVNEGEDYRIGATDLLRISVFQVPDLSFDEMRVDASGNIQMPLIGSIRAAGRTPNELADNIRGGLAERYLRDPQVTVTVAEAASQKVTVDGAVNKPGVYLMRGRTTLLQAVAMAEGPARIANLNSVAVFRTNEGRRMVAVFDLAAIRNGAAEDPVLLGDDVIVVDTSRLNAATREILAALPGLAVFGYF